MTRFVMIPGAGGMGWLWHRIVPLLEAEGHEAVALDLPGDDPSAGLEEYADLVNEAIGDSDDSVLVAQSMGAFVAPMVAERRAVAGIVFVNAMIPVPGERPTDWWENTGSEPARLAAAERGGYPTDLDLHTLFLHDVPEDLHAELMQRDGDEAAAAFEARCEFEAWPDVPVRVLAGADDRLFPPEFQHKLARDRLAVEAETVPGGHLLPLSYPVELVATLLDPQRPTR